MNYAVFSVTAFDVGSFLVDVVLIFIVVVISFVAVVGCGGVAGLFCCWVVCLIDLLGVRLQLTLRDRFLRHA